MQTLGTYNDKLYILTWEIVIIQKNYNIFDAVISLIR